LTKSGKQANEGLVVVLVVMMEEEDGCVVLAFFNASWFMVLPGERGG
jgi:hypothetical protein